MVTACDRRLLLRLTDDDAEYSTEEQRLQVKQVASVSFLTAAVVSLTDQHNRHTETHTRGGALEVISHRRC